MKAEDLMLGDRIWLTEYWGESLRTPRVVKVEGIEDYRDNGEGYSHCIMTDFDDELSEEEVQGIPINEEILLMNGFIRRNYGLFYGFYHPSDSIDSTAPNHFLHQNNKGEWMVECNPIGGVFIKISFVHELQHLLSMWGLKTISKKFNI